MENYGYNSDGNLSSKTGIGSYTYDASHKHAVASTTNGWSFQYDANGNMTQRVAGGTYNLTYDAENRLTASSNPANTSLSYDGDGKRVKGVTSTTTVYIGNYFEWTGSTSTMVKYYYDGATRVAMRTGSTLNWLFNDHLGSTSRITDASGNNPSTQLYKAWGETRYSSGTIPTTYLYTGQRRESYINLYWYGSRWYDDQLGRWIQPDNVIPGMGNSQAWDRFAYVNNNPVRYSDPTGHRACNGNNVDDCSHANDIEAKLNQLPESLSNIPEKIRRRYIEIRYWLYDTYGLLYISGTGKIKDVALLALIISSEFADTKKISEELYGESLEALSNEYHSTYGNQQTPCNGSCTLQDQLTWLEIIPGFLNPKPSAITGNFQPSLDDAAAAQHGYQYGKTNTSWIWGNANPGTPFANWIKNSMYKGEGPGDRYVVGAPYGNGYYFVVTVDQNKLITPQERGW